MRQLRQWWQSLFGHAKPDASLPEPFAPSAGCQFLNLDEYDRLQAMRDTVSDFHSQD